MSKVHTPKAHKNAEFIKAFADGKIIQWSLRTAGIRWHDFTGNPIEGPWVDDKAIWRVKPEGPWYRVALFKSPSGDTWTTTADNAEVEDNVQRNSCFVCWLTERVSYEV